VRRRPATALLAVLALAACGDDGPDYAAYCDAVDDGGGSIDEGYFGSDEHRDDLRRVEAAVPEGDERLAEALRTFTSFVEALPGDTATPNPSAWPGEVRVAYDRLTHTARDECP